MTVRDAPIVSTASWPLKCGARAVRSQVTRVSAAVDKDSASILPGYRRPPRVGACERVRAYACEQGCVGGCLRVLAHFDVDVCARVRISVSERCYDAARE